MSGRGATVCDLTIILRTRLLCGLYNHRSVPFRYRTLAKLYCVTVTAVTLAFSITFSSTRILWKFSLRYFPLYSLQCILVIASLFSGDEYIYRYFKINALTDITLDSRMVFKRLEKQMNKKYTSGLVFTIAFFVLRIVVYKYYDVNVFIQAFISAAIDHLLGSSCSGKLAIMQLFDARLLVLKRRLQRYGFRTLGRARAQPYTEEIYHEILQDLDATNNPLKLLLFIDLTANCCYLIAGMASYFVFGREGQNMDAFDFIGNILVGVLALISRLLLAFGHVVYLESAADHCDEMAVFTVTQLIKNPTASERQRMRDFLGALEQRSASYRLLRALPLNARKVLSVLGFCSTNAIILIQSLRSANNESLD